MNKSFVNFAIYLAGCTSFKKSVNVNRNTFKIYHQFYLFFLKRFLKVNLDQVGKLVTVKVISMGTVRWTDCLGKRIQRHVDVKYACQSKFVH